MLTDEMISSIATMRPSVPAKNYAESKKFYELLGFRARSLGPQLTEMSLGAHSFLLQDFYVPEYASNFVMHLRVENVDPWWEHISSLQLEETFKVQPPRAPKLEPWGLRVLYLFDPSPVLWHIASLP